MPLRVLIHPYLFLAEPWNGIDEHLLTLCNHLDKERFEVVILTHESHGPQTRLLAERAQVRAIEAPCSPGAPLRTQLRALRDLYTAHQVHVLHLHSPVAGGQAAAALAARLAGVRATVATYHQVQSAGLPVRTRVINRLIHRGLVQTTIAVSAAVRDSLVERAGLETSRIQIIHNGIDPPTSNSGGPAMSPRQPSSVRIGFFGRLSPEKGVDRIIEAVAHLDPLTAPIQTLIVGDGPECERLKDQAERLGLAERLQFLGFRTDARRLMEEIDIVVHVPVYEGFGLVLLEAMAVGKPVITNDAPGGMSEIVVNGETGVVVPAGSVPTLAGAIAALAADPAERRRLGENGRRRCLQHFSSRSMAARTAAAYEDVFKIDRSCELGRSRPT
jgi:glycosyltransferase involved in cell wall biosynthesis